MQSGVVVPVDQTAVDEVRRYVHSQISAGASDAQIVQELGVQGWDPSVMTVLVGSLRQQAAQYIPAARLADAPLMPEYQSPYQAAQVMPKPTGSAGATDMWLGLIICAIGLMVTYFSYTAAEGGGKYVIAWGAVLFGAMKFVRGLNESMSRN